MRIYFELNSELLFHIITYIVFMKKLLFILFLIPLIVLGQIKLEGVVRDTLNNPLELASLVAINKKTKGFESYVITDNLGKFSLELKKLI